MAYTKISDFERCTRCGRCLMECPVLRMDKEQAVAAVEKLIRGDAAPEVIGRCTFCFNCNRYCPVEGLRPHELILQRAIEQRGKVPAVLGYLANGRLKKNLFSDLYARLGTAEKAVLEKWSTPPDAREVLWIGCIGRLSCLDIDNSKVLAPLAKFGPPDLCCGELAYRLCGWKMYEETVERTIEALSRLKADRLVCYCGSCYNYFSSILPKVYGRSLPFELVSMYQWLWEQLEKGEIQVKRPRYYRAAVHESCYVSELEEDFADCLRRLYRSIGVDTVELAHHGDKNLSCGAVSVLRGLNVFSTTFREQRRKYSEVADAGVSDIALNCPGCYITMSFSNRLFRKRLHYMPDELLAAFGDDIRKPLGTRLAMIAATFAMKAPGAIFSR